MNHYHSIAHGHSVNFFTGSEGGGGRHHISTRGDATPYEWLYYTNLITINNCDGNSGGAMSYQTGQGRDYTDYTGDSETKPNNFTYRIWKRIS